MRKSHRCPWVRPDPPEDRACQPASRPRRGTRPRTPAEGQRQPRWLRPGPPVRVRGEL